jgi:copper chaperone NosL
MHWSIKIITPVIVMAACTAKPVAIQYGRDACGFCRMTIMDPAFGGEIITRKGKVYKFDGTECLLNYYKAHLASVQDFTTILVADYSKPGRLMDAKQAVFLQDEKIKSPMGAHLAAFPDTRAARQFSEDHRIIMGWNNLIKIDL